MLRSKRDWGKSRMSTTISTGNKKMVSLSLVKIPELKLLIAIQTVMSLSIMLTCPQTISTKQNNSTKTMGSENTSILKCLRSLTKHNYLIKLLWELKNKFRRRLMKAFRLWTKTKKVCFTKCIWEIKVWGIRSEKTQKALRMCGSNK